MSKLSRAKAKIIDRYWNGVFTGLFTGCLLVTVLVMVFFRVQGLTVAISPEQIAALVQTSVQNEAKINLPQVLEGLKEELPAEILKNLDGQILSVGLGGNQDQPPAEVTGVIAEELSLVVEEGVYNVINGYDTSKFEEQIGQDAYQMVENALKQNIIGRTYLIKATDWFSVPVRIIGANIGANQGLKIGI